MALSYNEEKLVSKLVWLAIENGNSATAKAFEPTPEEYEMLHGIVNKIDEHIEFMQKSYGLK